MPAPVTAALTCPWPLEWDEVSLYCTPADGLTDDQQAAILANATETIWWLTGRQYGICTSVFRFAGECGCWNPWSSVRPGRAQATGGQNLHAVDLDPMLTRPVANVMAVKVDGTLTDDWQVRDRRWLQRLPAGVAWPTISEQADPDSGLEVSWTWGVEPPAQAIQAAAWLACELSKATKGKKCALPDTMVSVQREGVNVAFIDYTKITEGGGTGVQRIDAICHRLWPLGLREPSRMLSPEDLLTAPAYLITQTGAGSPSPSPAPDPFTFEFLSPLSSWEIIHGLGRHVVVEVLDLAGHSIWAQVVEDPDQNEVTVTFNTPQAGFAVIR